MTAIGERGGSWNLRSTTKNLVYVWDITSQQTMTILGLSTIGCTVIAVAAFVPTAGQSVLWGGLVCAGIGAEQAWINDQPHFISQTITWDRSKPLAVRKAVYYGYRRVDPSYPDLKPELDMYSRPGSIFEFHFDVKNRTAWEACANPRQPFTAQEGDPICGRAASWQEIRYPDYGKGRGAPVWRQHKNWPSYSGEDSGFYPDGKHDPQPGPPPTP
jgi:hypothetical protein